MATGQSLGRGTQMAMFLSRWLMAPFLVGLGCSVVLVAIRFFINLGGLVTRLLVESWQDLVVDVLNLIDLALTANLVLIAAFSAYGNYIRKIDQADQSDWPSGLIDIDFSV